MEKKEYDEEYRSAAVLRGDSRPRVCDVARMWKGHFEHREGWIPVHWCSDV